jgi:hypothetical protein
MVCLSSELTMVAVATVAVATVAVATVARLEMAYGLQPRKTRVIFLPY